MKKMNLVTRFFCSCAGADTSTLNQCNSAEQRKMAIIGSTVLITPLLGIASGTFAMLTFSNNLQLSVGFGLLWGFIIFVIERAVVANTRPGEFNMAVIARLLLAMIFAMVIAVPMELKVFEDAIQEKLVSNIYGIENEINVKYNNQIAKINNDLSAEKAKVEALRHSYIGEVDGTSGSMVVHRGPIAKEKEKLWTQEAEYFQKMQTKSEDEIRLLNNQKNAEISTIKEAQAKGFLGRMTALGQLQKEDRTVWWGIWLIRLFFLSIELTPIFIKLSSGKNGNIYFDIAAQNGEMAVSVNAQMESVRAEEMVKQQKALVNKELLQLQYMEEKAVMEDAQKRFDFYMSQLEKVTDRKLQAQQYIFATVKDEQLCEQLMKQIEEIYEDFQKTIILLINKKQAGENYINNLS